MTLLKSPYCAERAFPHALTFFRFSILLILTFFLASNQGTVAVMAQSENDGRMLISDFQPLQTSPQKSPQKSPQTSRWYDTSGGKMLLENIPEGLRVTTHFAENPRTERVSIDAQVNLDLTNWNQFQVEATLSNPKAFGSSSLYFHSPGGWYSCSSGVPSKGGKITFRKEDFQMEGTPAGWDQINSVRLSFWKMGAQESQIVFSSLVCVSEPVIFVSVLNSQGVALWIGKNNARILAEQLSDLGINSDQAVIPQEATEEEWLKLLTKRQALIINHSRHLKPETREFLLQWAKENQTVVHFLSQDLREAPIESDAFLSILGNAPQLKAQIEKNCIAHAVTVLGNQTANAAEIEKEAALIFAEKGLCAGVEFCQNMHLKNLQTTLKDLDSDHSMKFRGWWNHNGLGAYPGDWKRTAKELHAAGFTAVFPNMLWVGSALYPSQFAPTGAEFEKYGDQLAQCVEACHAEGIEVHVWRVCFNMQSHTSPELLEKYRSENRLQVDRQGETIPWLCPSNPANIELETAAMIEIADRYDVDGVHFDYIRYQNGSGCFCDGCKKRFESETGIKVMDWPKDVCDGEHKDAFSDWRAAQITNIVRRVHDEMEEKHPKVKISAAVFQAYPSARYSVGQDWALWAKEGYVDFLCPMNYTLDSGTFEGLAIYQKTVVPEGFPLYFGIGEWKLTPDETLEQIQKADQVGAQGFTIFNLSEAAAKRILPPLTPASH